MPLGRRVGLPGRGVTFMRELEGPPGAPTLMLLHGWLASGGMNWFRVFEPLSEHFRVIAPDLRGHGRGIHSRRHFRLADCADDTAALCDVLGTGPVIAVGYSMGGPVAQLLWKRHRDLVDGLVLVATGLSMVPTQNQRTAFTTIMAVAAGTSRVGGLLTRLPSSWVRSRAPVSTNGKRPDSIQRWAAAEMRRHNWRMIMEAGRAVGRFDAGDWLGEIDVSTAVLVTARDKGIPPESQEQLARIIPYATTHYVDDGHTLCTNGGFAEPLLEVCLEVAGTRGPRLHS
ncbi:MAG: 2-succinyl-6-hydroxy-2,4-cyclohexadiene-1-carboxylate synthase [Acidimicrobiales bacterium]|nr:2-succinyl-6-hydroxy-2,4-cyclohexadiene-1-carboxylate synthase [Acidimicrobiales bacterium]